MKFFKHDFAKERKVYDEKWDKAGKKYPRSNTKRRVEAIISMFEYDAKHGIPDCYSHYKEALPDRGMTFPVSKKEGMMILNHKRMIPVFETIQKEWDFDLKAWMERLMKVGIETFMVGESRKNE
jgi:hypothetical protein